MDQSRIRPKCRDSRQSGSLLQRRAPGRKLSKRQYKTKYSEQKRRIITTRPQNDEDNNTTSINRESNNDICHNVLMFHTKNRKAWAQLCVVMMSHGTSRTESVENRGIPEGLISILGAITAPCSMMPFETVL